MSFSWGLLFCVWLGLTGMVAAQSDENGLLLPGEKPLAQCVPFDMPDVATLRQSPRKVYAHYFVPFPISIDNKPPDADQYVLNGMNPNGFGKRYLEQGGKMRQRPLPRAVRPEEDWLLCDMKLEVQRGVNMGLDGFITDIVSDEGINWERFLVLMQAAHLVDPDFKILIMAGMPALFRNKPESMQSPQRMAKMLLTLAQYPSAARTVDGRLIVSAFRGNDKSPDWWRQVFAILHDAGEKVYFVPLIQPWWDDAGVWKKEVQAFLPIVDGLSTWGPRWASAQEKWTGFASEIRAFDKLSFMPVGAQDMRPKSLIYWEAGNTRSYRALWQAAIDGGADWVQLITWNDYSEATEISPSTGTQFSLYDLSAYYLTWYKLGRAPAITRDVLYYAHRVHSMDAKPDASKQPKLFKNAAPDPVSDQIECLAFATAPGTLRITVGDQVSEQAVNKGFNTMYVPMHEGTPVFTLLRDGKAVVQATSRFPINNHITYQNPLYHGGSSTRQ
jgi:hypothetical protein